MLILLLWLIIVIIISIFSFLLYFIHTIKLKLKLESEIHKKDIETAEINHTLRSERVRFGQIYEQFLPFVSNFKYNRKDVRFFGSPIDLVVFDGLDDGNLKEILFLEIKSGKPSLSKRERMVRDTIKDKRVRWELIQPKNI